MVTVEDNNGNVPVMKWHVKPLVVEARLAIDVQQRQCQKHGFFPETEHQSLQIYVESAPLRAARSNVVIE